MKKVFGFNRIRNETQIKLDELYASLWCVYVHITDFTATVE